MSTSRFFVNVLAFFGVCFLCAWVGDWLHRNEVPTNYNPHHAVNGIDTVYDKDSTYTIQVKIIQAEENPPPEYDNGR